MSKLIPINSSRILSHCVLNYFIHLLPLSFVLDKYAHLDKSTDKTEVTYYMLSVKILFYLPQFEGWEQKRSKYFFTYINLDLFCFHPSTCFVFQILHKLPVLQWYTMVLCYCMWCLSLHACSLTLNLLNFFNGIILLPFFKLSIIIFRGIKEIKRNKKQKRMSRWECEVGQPTV